MIGQTTKQAGISGPAPAAFEQANSVVQEELAASRLLLDSRTRRQLWSTVFETIESYQQNAEQLPVSPNLDVDRIRSVAQSYTFEEPIAAAEAFDRIASELVKAQVHTPHPRYFGLFNPAPATMSIAADALVAAFNPQLAGWSHSPLAVEIERHLVRTIAGKFGLGSGSADGVFTSGGAEANQTALLAALASQWPETAVDGLRALQSQPTFYVSSEGHHSFAKAARTAGLGTRSLREVSAGEDLRMDASAVREAIRRDRAAGLAPFLLVATAGTTGAGVIDPLDALATVAQEEGLWFHVDAAWGGAAALVPELRSSLKGIERVDSITFDPHKWLSVSMGAGMFLTRHSGILRRLFTIETSYMPKEANRLPIVDPYVHSLQWSRRFIGLKLFLSLAVAGWEGYAATLRHQAEMGHLLRRRLTEERWKIVNDTPLPVVCFVDAANDRWDEKTCQRIADGVVNSGDAWISTVKLGPRRQPALRACVTNFRTEARHVDALVSSLHRERQEAR